MIIAGCVASSSPVANLSTLKSMVILGRVAGQLIRAALADLIGISHFFGYLAKVASYCQIGNFAVCNIPVVYGNVTIRC